VLEHAREESNRQLLESVFGYAVREGLLRFILVARFRPAARAITTPSARSVERPRARRSSTADRGSASAFRPRQAAADRMPRLRQLPDGSPSKSPHHGSTFATCPGGPSSYIMLHRSEMAQELWLCAAQTGMPPPISLQGFDLPESRDVRIDRQLERNHEGRFTKCFTSLCPDVTT
jgi:hypothetical protein